MIQKSTHGVNVLLQNLIFLLSVANRYYKLVRFAFGIPLVICQKFSFIEWTSISYVTSDNVLLLFSTMG